MKKIFTYAISALLAVLLFTSCAKEKVVYQDDNAYWFSQEQGNVVYSNNSCGYYVVETRFGYTIIRNLDGLRTYDGDLLYGNFGAYGTGDFYNYTANVITLGSVIEYDISYSSAQAAIDYYCPYGRSIGAKIRQGSSAVNKVQRNATSAIQ